MKNGGSQQPKLTQGGIAYGQPYLQGTANDATGNSASRVGSTTNLKQYINELKKVSTANKTGGKRGHSSNKTGGTPGGSNALRQSQQAVVQGYNGLSGIAQTTKNGMASTHG